MREKHLNLAAAFFTCFMALCIFAGPAGADMDRAQKQAELDKACEEARELQLAPMRQQQIDECVEKQKKDRTECEGLYANYGARSGIRAPLFYDLPACEEASAYKRSYRQAK